MKKSNILLIIGMLMLLVGAVMSSLEFRPYADYVLVAGAVLVIFRGAIHNREKTEEKDTTQDHTEQSDDNNQNTTQ